MTETATTDPQLSHRAAPIRMAITRMARRLRQESGSELGLSSVAALATIERQGPLGPSRLAEWEGVQRPTATRIIAGLEDGGFIERADDPDDGRCSIISISAAGRAHLETIRGKKDAYLVERLAELPDEQLQTLEQAAAILDGVLEGERA